MNLTRREWISLATAAAGTAWVAPTAWAQSAWYEQGIIIDGLGFPGGRDQADDTRLIPEELADIQTSGLTATHLTVGAVGQRPPLEAFESAVRDIAGMERQIDGHSTILARVRTARDILAAKVSGHTGLIYGLQDGVPFEDDLDRLETLHQLGIRIIQPTYNLTNALGSGCMAPSDNGLSAQGRKAVARIHELNILLDMSHCGRRTTQDAFSVSRQPVSFTHTGCFALAEHPRHRTDTELRAAADSGGIIGIFVMPYLARGKQPTADDVMAHLDHAINVAGEDNVSLGTDGMISPVTVDDAFKEHFREMTRKRKELGIAAPFETETGYLFASDLNTARRFETLGEKLLQRGYSQARVEKVLGLNLLRVYGSIWDR